jgi:O-methyltransferase involved in polyketide biosynthesis
VAEVEVFQLDKSSPRTGRQPGVRAQLDRALVRSARTLFVCDGLLDPIEPATIRAILRTIGDSCYGSRLACVYTDGELISGSAPFGASQKSRPAVPKLGEPSATGLDARSLPARLACAGLVLDADVSVTEYARRWLGEGRSDLRGYSFYRLATAHVRAPSPDNPLEVVPKTEE